MRTKPGLLIILHFYAHNQLHPLDCQFEATLLD